MIYGYGYVFNCDLSDGLIDGWDWLVGWLVGGYLGGYHTWVGRDRWGWLGLYDG